MKFKIVLEVEIESIDAGQAASAMYPITNLYNLNISGLTKHPRITRIEELPEPPKDTK